MEGVLVSAKKSGSTITVTVVSDARGRYAFPAGRLGSGRYALSIRAGGYDLDSPTAVDIASGKSATADIKLRKTASLASQLANSDWLISFPGTNEQKASVQNCSHCHTLRSVWRGLITMPPSSWMCSSASAPHAEFLSADGPAGWTGTPWRRTNPRASGGATPQAGRLSGNAESQQRGVSGSIR